MIRVVNDNGICRYVPCGRCSECIKNSSQIWIYRNNYELSKSDAGIFVTLTYNDDNLPIVEGVDVETGEYSYNPGFDKRHLQLFFKRFRKSLSAHGITFRYLVVSEYGGTTDRPHYHGLFYFRNFPADGYNVVSKIEDIIVKEWIYGHVYFGEITDSSIAYCCKYVLKDKEPPPGCVKPFVLYSRNPGIGMDYIKDNQEWHSGNYDRQYYKPINSNVKIPLNYYMKSKLYDLTPLSRDRIEIDKRRISYRIKKFNVISYIDKAMDNGVTETYDFIDYRNRYENNEVFFEKLKYRKLKEKI